jgi:hypothetical protein
MAYPVTPPRSRDKGGHVMTTDIVIRLRTNFFENLPICDEAANQIEFLRAQNTELKKALVGLAKMVRDEIPR